MWNKKPSRRTGKLNLLKFFPMVLLLLSPTVAFSPCRPKWFLPANSPALVAMHPFVLNAMRGLGGRHTPAMNAREAEKLAYHGSELADSGDYEEAAKQLEASLALVPDSAATLNDLGFVKEQLDLPSEALECYQRAIDVHPSNIASHLNRGALLHNLRRYEEALEAVHTAVRLDPKDADSWGVLGMMHSAKGSLELAQDALSKAVALAPDDASQRTNLATVLRNMGRFDEAFRELSHAEQIGVGGEDDDLYFYTPLVFAPSTLAAIATRHPVGEIAETAAKGGRTATLLSASALPESAPLEWIERLRRVHVTRVATDAECDWAIKTAEAHAAKADGWDDAGHHEQYPTNDLVVAENEELARWVQELLRERIWPAIKAQFDIEASELWLEDCFLVKYEADGQAGLGEHADDSELSFNLLLSDPASFEGGGTAFSDAEPEEVTVHPGRGEVITHYGRVLHEGKPVTGGAPRYILAGFVRAQPLAKAWRELGHLPSGDKYQEP